MNEVRQKIYVPHLRALAGNVNYKCQHCRIYSAKPAVPKMAPLPAAHLKAYCRPFSYVGIDFFGPFTVKVGRRQEKGGLHYLRAWSSGDTPRNDLLNVDRVVQACNPKIYCHPWSPGGNLHG